MNNKKEVIANWLNSNWNIVVSELIMLGAMVYVGSMLSEKKDDIFEDMIEIAQQKGFLQVTIPGSDGNQTPITIDELKKAIKKQ